MKNSHYYPHSGGILGCHAYVDFQHTNYLLNVTICERLRCTLKLQTISDAFSHIASRFLKVALAIKFALNWLAGPQCAGTPPGPRRYPAGTPPGSRRNRSGTALLRQSRRVAYDAWSQIRRASVQTSCEPSALLCRLLPLPLPLLLPLPLPLCCRRRCQRQ